MKNLILNSIIRNIKKYYSYDEIKIKEIRYGLESLYVSITKIIVIFIISYFINTVSDLLLLFLTFGILRITGFGVHAKKSIHCWFTSIPLFVIVPYIIKNIYINDYLITLLSIISILLLAIYAPADTEKRPLINSKKRIVYKVLTIIISIIYYIIIIHSQKNYINKLLFFSILIESILVLPITYKLLGVKYKNYMNYKKGGKK